MQLALFEYYFDRTQRSAVFFHKSRSGWIRVSFFGGVNYILLRQLLEHHESKLLLGACRVD